MKARVVDKVFSVFCLLAVAIISIICNAGDFISGNNGEINLLTVAITIIYVLYCLAFALFSHTHKKNIIVSMILSVITLIVAIMGLLVSTFRLTIDILIPFAILFLSPFQGLTAVMQSNWVVIYSIIIIISILWVFLTLLNFRRYNKNINTKR